MTFPSTELSYEVYLLRTKRIVYIADKFFLGSESFKSCLFMFKMPWPPSLRRVLLNDDDSFTTFSPFFFSINFSGLFQFGSLKTSNASKFPGIEFWGAEPRVRRRNKNSTYFVYLLLKTSREVISRFNFTFLVAFTVVVTKTLFRFY